MPSTDSSVVLITISGPDKPGITAELTEILAQANASILDMGQAVIHGLLSLSILFELSPDASRENSTIKDLLFKATELGMHLEFQVIDTTRVDAHQLNRRRYHYAMTLIGNPLSARSVHEVTHILAECKLNIDQIQRLSEGAFGCIELLVSSSEQLDEKAMKSQLLTIAKQQQIDIALQAEGLFRRTKRLVVLDMDSTLIAGEVVDEFARIRGVYDEVAQITEAAMNGELDFDESLRRRVEKLEGLTHEEVDQVFSQIKLTAGGETLIPSLKKLGYKIALISGGFRCIADRIKEKYGLDYVYANELQFQNGKCTGKVIPPIVNAQRKADLLDVICQQEKIHTDQVIAIGDGANDLPMLQKAGLGIAFNAKPTVREQADTSLNQKNLHSIFYLLGISGRDLNEVLDI